MIQLQKIPTILDQVPTTAPDHIDKKEAKKEMAEIVEQIGEWQNRLYAERKQSILIVLQGMDAAGKDGTTRALFQGCSPAGISVHAFKKPTETEFAHDFLWRVHQQVPQKGMITVFNRSHYEDVLIQRVHKWIDEDRVTQRIESINQFEKLLQYDNQTTVLKFYMHISPEKQLEKLQERIDDPRKNWKHSPQDWEERKYWSEYRHAYEDLFARCTTAWHILPCDQEWYRDYMAAKTLLKTLQDLNPQYPTLSDQK